MRSPLSYLLGFAILMLGAGGDIAANPDKPPANPRANIVPEHAIVPLYAAGPRALAMLTIADGPPAPVIFDTGEDQAFLVTSYAKRLNLRIIGSSPFLDMATGAKSTVPLLSLPSPKLSGVAVDPPLTRMVDYDEPDMVGVFGPRVFGSRLVTLELSRNRIRISPLTPGRLPRAEAAPYVEEIPALEINVAGLPVLAHLDSGANTALSLGRSLMSKVKLKKPAIVVGQATSASGTQDVFASQIDGDVKIGPLVLHDPEVNFFGSGTGANVGYQLMRQLTLVMDPTGQRSWVLDPADLGGPLDQFAGQFGPRTVRVENGKLIHQREGRPAFELQYLGGDLFEMPATGDEIQFYRTGERVTKLELITTEGDVLGADRAP